MQLVSQALSGACLYVARFELVNKILNVKIKTRALFIINADIEALLKIYNQQ